MVPVPGVLSAVISPPCASDQGARDGQAQARSGGRPALVEPIEDVRQIGGRDAAAACPPRVIRSPPPSTRRLDRRPARRGVCGESRSSTTFVSTSRIRSGSRFDQRQIRARSGLRAATPFASACAGQRAHDVADEDRDVGRLPLQRQRAAFRMRERPHILDQPRQHARLLEHQPQPLIVTRIHAVEQPLEASLNDAQRRPQLVRDVGHQLPPQRVLRLQPRRPSC